MTFLLKVVLRRLSKDVPADGDPPPKLDEEGSEIVHAKYVVGADGKLCDLLQAERTVTYLHLNSPGAHSWVRKTLGITMDGESTSKTISSRLGVFGG